MRGIEKVEEAKEEDIPEIVDLILMDEENSSSYTSDELAEQMLDRMRTGMGTSYIIRENGKIVAHLSIAAQTDKFRVAALTIVHPDYRNTLYGTMVDSFLINELGKDGKRNFAFMMDERRIRMFLVMGNTLAAEYGKLVKNK
jgi:predicted GNAT family acetyltransferase